MSNHTTQPDDQSTSQEAGGATDTGLEYEDVTITTTAGYRPMFGIIATVVLSGVVLVGYPIYFHEPGDGVTLLTYTGLLWGAVITAAAIAHEYYVTRNEDRDEAGENA
jgi:hypothetical protein